MVRTRAKSKATPPTNFEPDLLPQLEPEPREEPDRRRGPSELQGESHSLSEENSGQGQHPRFQGLVKRKIRPSVYMDEEILSRLGMLEDVMSLFDTQGWSKFMTGCFPTYPELTLEFLSSLHVKFNDSKAGGVIRFHLGRKEYNWSLIQVDRVLGFVSGGLRGMPDGFNHTDFWHSITVENEPYQASSAKATSIRNPTLRNIQRVMTGTIFARQESRNVVRQTELEFLWAMLNRQKLSTSYYLMSHLAGVQERNRGAIVVGGVVTAIAKACGVNFDDYAVLNENPKVDEATLDHMGVLYRDGTAYSWGVTPKVHYPLPSPQLTTPWRPENLKMLHSPFTSGRITPSTGTRNLKRRARHDGDEDLRSIVMEMRADIRELLLLMRARQPPPQ